METSLPRLVIKFNELDDDYVESVNTSKGRFKIIGNDVRITWTELREMHKLNNNILAYEEIFKAILTRLSAALKIKIDHFQMCAVHDYDPDGEICLRIIPGRDGPEAQILKAMLTNKFTVTRFYSNLLSREYIPSFNQPAVDEIVYKQEDSDESQDSDSESDDEKPKPRHYAEPKPEPRHEPKPEPIHKMAPPDDTISFNRKRKMSPPPSSIGSSIVRNLGKMRVFSEDRNINRDLLMPMTEIVDRITSGFAAEHLMIDVDNAIRLHQIPVPENVKPLSDNDLEDLLSLTTVDKTELGILYAAIKKRL